jgi:hypothetical protein
MPTSSVTRFNCPHCAASYQLVQVEAGDTASDGEVACLRSHRRPLQRDMLVRMSIPSPFTPEPQTGRSKLSANRVAAKAFSGRVPPTSAPPANTAPRHGRSTIRAQKSPKMR